MTSTRSGSDDIPFTGIVLVILLVVGVICCFTSCTVIPPGESGVQVTFGSVSEQPLGEGTHFLNPFSGVDLYDVKQVTMKEEKCLIPSQDQLMTTVDVSVQYRVVASMTPQIRRETGLQDQLVAVQLEPKLRSLLREVGKEVPHAEDFFMEATQARIQNELLAKLADYCRPKGIEIQAVLLRDMQMPDVIQNAVKSKKEREQMAIRQESELQRFTVEQQQKVATAEAEKKAAELTASKTRIEADAEAYRIKAINDAASTNPVYVQLQALKTLSDITKDPATKLYFLDGQSSTPLPLLHLTDAPASVALPTPPAKK